MVPPRVLVVDGITSTRVNVPQPDGDTDDSVWWTAIIKIKDDHRWSEASCLVCDGRSDNSTVGMRWAPQHPWYTRQGGHCKEDLPILRFDSVSVADWEPVSMEGWRDDD